MTDTVRRQTLSDLLRRTAARLPAKTAIVCGATRWTWREFDDTVSRLAAGLHQSGVAPGDRVAVLARNSCAESHRSCAALCDSCSTGAYCTAPSILWAVMPRG